MFPVASVQVNWSGVALKSDGDIVVTWVDSQPGNKDAELCEHYNSRIRQSRIFKLIL